MAALHSLPSLCVERERLSEWQSASKGCTSRPDSPNHLRGVSVNPWPQAVKKRSLSASRYVTLGEGFAAPKPAVER